MTTTTQSITQEINQDLSLRLNNPSEVSHGRTLGESDSISIGRLSRHREGRIVNRLGALRSAGLRLKITSLMGQLRGSGLSRELQAELDNWMGLFSSIEEGSAENRAYAFAALIFRVLRPNLLRVGDGERVRLVDFEDTCRDILRQILPMGALDGFLDNCEEALEEESIYRSLSARLEFAGQVEMNAINNMHSELDARIRELYESFKQRLTALQDSRRNMITSADSQLEAITGGVESLGSGLLSQMESLRGLASMDPALVRSLNDLESILQRSLR